MTMQSTFLRKIAGLSLEEKILNSAVILTCVSIFFPWFGGRWIGGEMRAYSGFGFYTSFIGFALFLLNGYVLAIGMAPLTSSTRLLKKAHENTVRLVCCAASVLLTLAALSVLIRVTFEFQAMEIRFGVGSTLFGSLASLFYSFLLRQEEKNKEVTSLFTHEEESKAERREAADFAKTEAAEKLMPKKSEPQAMQPTLNNSSVPPPPAVDDQSVYRF